MKLIKTALIFSAVLALASGAYALAGGPDGFGYSFVDCDEPGGPPVNLEDNGPNVVIDGHTDDVLLGPFAIGFDFNFYGNAYADVWVSSNGFIAFQDVGNSHCCSGDPIPSPQAPNLIVAGFWEDLTPDSSAETSHEQFPGQFNVTFRNVRHFGDSGARVNFQYKLFEGTDIVEVHYGSMISDGGPTHSAGIEDGTGTIGLQYFFGGGPPPENCAVRYALPQPTPSPTPSPTDEPDASAPALSGSGLAALVAILLITSVVIIRRRMS